jgi:hypothetical protein
MSRMSGVPVELVITNGTVTLQACSLYRHRVPVLNAHHVIPESWWLAAGRPVASPLRELCPDCHEAVHVAIDGLLRGLDCSLLPPRCIALAQAALDGAAAAGLTPALTL